MMLVQGVGTAVGELPPYFMARASRLSGEVDEEEQEIENLLQERREHPSELVNYRHMIDFNHFNAVEEYLYSSLPAPNGSSYCRYFTVNRLI